ncbi:muscle M-line assembly protein unc-89-like [Pecten maximus]|uniref:muscle M-line assembly protein unc-89-like n=1 Tax=Pecten maximus TaxID=6579 RepID=UPI001458316B|nr:muscle M-line assembly protein unc-89-like [Pecten maximus]
MPRSRRSTGKSPAPVAKEEAPATRKTRGAAAPAAETPSPKKSRKRSPSPSPAPRGRSRGRGAKEPDTKKEKGQGDDVEEPSPKKGRVTRAVMQQDATPTRGRASSSRKAAEPKKPAPSPTPKGRSSSRQKAAPTPTKAEEPSRSRSRSKPAKPEPKTPEPKPAKAKSQPKSQTKKTPVKKATPSPRKAPAKPKPSPKPTASRSRSRGKKEEKASDMPSAQIILTKIDSPTKSNTSLAEKETSPPSRSRARSSAKTPPQKASPKESRRSKSSEKSTPPTRRGRRSAEAKEEVEDEAKEEDSKENEDEEVASEKVKAVDESAKSEEVNKDEEMDTKDASAETEDKVVETEKEVAEEENEKVEESKDKIEKESEEEESGKVSEEEKKDGETETADVEETDEKLEEEDQKQEEAVEEKMEEDVVNDKEEPCKPEEESPALKSSPPLETSPVKELQPLDPSPAKESSATEQCKPPEIEEISDDEPVEEEPMEEDVVEKQKEEESKETAATPAAEESMTAKAETAQEVPEPVITDGEQQNGSPDDPLSSPTRKRKWDELDDEGEDASPKKVRRSIDMTDVTSEGVVTTNGEDQISKQETEEESMETSVDQKVLEPEVAQTSTDTGNHNIEQDYVVVNMDEIPAANSTEVLQCIPTETPTETPKKEAATDLAAEQSQSIAPAAEVVSDVNQEQTTASLSSPTSEFNPVLSRKYIPNPSYHQSGDTNKQFSVVSYNILAQCHLERNDYSFTESQYLAESYRHQNLMKEIEYLGADLVCMQEVGPKYFESMLKPAMTRLGYEGVMKKRTQDYFDEGEATFYRTSRFSVVNTQTYSLADLAEQELEDGGVSDEVKVSIRKYLDLPDVLVLTKLRCNTTGNLLCVGNIHVQWGKMEIPDAQCIQIVCAIKELAKQGGSDCHAQILCGDFNSEETSPGYKLAMEGYITDEVLKQLQALENLEMPDSSKAALVNHLWRAFQHTSDLRSAYQSAQGCEPSVTSYNRVMLAAVDYIFYCGSNLHNVGVLETAKEGNIKATGGIPDRLFPSDHVSIKAVFAFS